ncbi:chemotaxis protein CheW [Salinivibrio sp. ES.052]|uniref:chemotaxis protein CheW n=1 Tax=Salinivibrio sp. ES.052 TaxID=1882823 RepID=UPI00092AF0C7|nr:chemotaxis protein CheW [Salinivibrio sp. ES.052]SIO04622.1 purine-binding chemotaxis protein CheW [Salinivibrio sp. ES.052]
MQTVMEPDEVLDIDDRVDRLQGSDYLSFELDGELYGVDIQTVEEIRVWEKPTLLPRSPAFILGVINLRGMIVPVMDLRLRFDTQQVDYHRETVVLVLRASEAANHKIMGVVVDAVSDVVDHGEGQIMPPIGDSQVIAYVSGLLNVGERVMSLVNVDELLRIERWI